MHSRTSVSNISSTLAEPAPAATATTTTNSEGGGELLPTTTTTTSMPSSSELLQQRRSSMPQQSSSLGSSATMHSLPPLASIHSRFSLSGGPNHLKASAATIHSRCSSISSWASHGGSSSFSSFADHHSSTNHHLNSMGQFLKSIGDLNNTDGGGPNSGELQIQHDGAVKTEDQAIHIVLARELSEECLLGDSHHSSLTLQDGWLDVPPVVQASSSSQSSTNNAQLPPKRPFRKSSIVAQQQQQSSSELLLVGGSAPQIINNKASSAPPSYPFRRSSTDDGKAVAAAAAAAAAAVGINGSSSHHHRRRGDVVSPPFAPRSRSMDMISETSLSVVGDTNKDLPSSASGRRFAPIIMRSDVPPPLGAAPRCPSRRSSFERPRLTRDSSLTLSDED